MSPTIWLLVLVIRTNGGGITSQTIEFWDDKKSCEDAKVALVRANTIPDGGSNSGTKASAFCVPRPEGP